MPEAINLSETPIQNVFRLCALANGMETTFLSPTNGFRIGYVYPNGNVIHPENTECSINHIDTDPETAPAINTGTFYYNRLDARGALAAEPTVVIEVDETLSPEDQLAFILDALPTAWGMRPHAATLDPVVMDVPYEVYAPTERVGSGDSAYVDDDTVKGSFRIPAGSPLYLETPASDSYIGGYLFHIHFFTPLNSILLEDGDYLLTETDGHILLE